jgi:hypothetical protein
MPFLPLVKWLKWKLFVTGTLDDPGVLGLWALHQSLRLEQPFKKWMAGIWGAGQSELITL